jgi:hypothetical protein
VALYYQGELRQAAAQFRRAIALGSKDASGALSVCERQLSLLKRLAAVLRGDDRPTSAAEGVEFARLCRQPFQRRYAAAADFYADAFAAQPRLADDLQQQHRYNAAGAAALAGCGQGEDVAKLDGKERARLRAQALTWLRADLALWSRVLGNLNPQARAAAVQALRHWQEDGDLAVVRDSAALADLPHAERARWCKLWADVAAVLAKPQASGAQQGAPRD